MNEPLLANDSPPRSPLRYWRYAAAFVVGALSIVDFNNHYRWVTLEYERAWNFGIVIASTVLIGATSWPLGHYGTVWRVSAAGSAGISIAATIYNIRKYQIGFIENGWAVVVAAFAIGIVSVLQLGLPLSAVVWCRRKLWPVRTPGFCAKCGYCLRGLTSFRCPECGTEFDPPRLLSSQTSGNPMD